MESLLNGNITNSCEAVDKIQLTCSARSSAISVFPDKLSYEITLVLKSVILSVLQQTSVSCKG